MAEVLNIDQVIAKALDKTVDVFEAVSKTLTNAVTEYGPQAVEAVLWVIRLDHIQILATGVLWLIVLLVFWFKWWKVLKADYAKNNNRVEYMSTQVCVPTFFALFFTVIISLNPVVEIFNVWNYVAVAKPEMWIAKQVVVKVESMAKDATKKK